MTVAIPPGSISEASCIASARVLTSFKAEITKDTQHVSTTGRLKKNIKDTDTNVPTVAELENTGKS